jgi:hypothetical protein
MTRQKDKKNIKKAKVLFKEYIDSILSKERIAGAEIPNKSFRNIMKEIQKEHK